MPSKEELLGLPKFYNLNDLLARNTFNQTYLVKNFIIEKNVIYLVADSNVGKSFLSLYLCVCIQNGLSFLGMETKKTNCLYVDNDAGEGETVKRLKQLGLTDPDNLLKCPKLNFLISDKIDFANRIEVKKYAKYIKDLGIGFVVLDTLRSLMSEADEVRSKDMNILTKMILDFSRWSGATVLVLHHTSKAGLQYAGSNVIKCNSSDMYIITQNKGSYVIKSEKNRGKKVNNINYDMTFNEEDTRVFFTCTADKDLEEQKKLIAFLTFNPGASQNDLINLFEIKNKSTCITKIENFVKSGIIRKEKKNNRFYFFCGTIF